MSLIKAKRRKYIFWALLVLYWLVILDFFSSKAYLKHYYYLAVNGSSFSLGTFSFSVSTIDMSIVRATNDSVRVNFLPWSLENKDAVVSLIRYSIEDMTANNILQNVLYEGAECRLYSHTKAFIEATGFTAMLRTNHLDFSLDNEPSREEIERLCKAITPSD